MSPEARIVLERLARIGAYMKPSEIEAFTGLTPDECGLALGELEAQGLVEIVGWRLTPVGRAEAEAEPVEVRGAP